MTGYLTLVRFCTVCVIAMIDATGASNWRQKYLAEHPITNLEEFVVILQDDERYRGISLFRNGKLSLEDGNSQARKGKWPPNVFEWPNDRDGWPEVPYKFGDEVTVKAAVKEGIAHWEEHTCIRFRDVSSDVVGLFYPHIVFRSGDVGCYSLVGKTPIATVLGQDIVLTMGCQFNLGAVVHEIGHAIGFYHEQSRYDRNEFVAFNWANVQPTAGINFLKKLTENYHTPYDYYSVMHYGMLSFSRNGRSTMVTLDPMAQGLMGNNRNGLSHMDARAANFMYDCVDKWLKKCNLSNDPCRNRGYYGSLCACVCPPGTSGDYCEYRNSSYLDALKAKLLPDNLIVTTERNISTPNYPKPQENGLNYTTLITAPSCHRVLLTFHDFDTKERCTLPGLNNLCCMDGMEIRLKGDDPLSGQWYCGKEITPTKRLESEGTTMVLYYKAFNYAKFNVPVSFKGYLASVTFERVVGCV